MQKGDKYVVFDQGGKIKYVDLDQQQTSKSIDGCLKYFLYFTIWSRKPAIKVIKIEINHVSFLSILLDYQSELCLKSHILLNGTVSPPQTVFMAVLLTS
jgi:hypothetical protein